MMTCLKKEGYLLIPNVLSKETCALLSEYALLKTKIKPNVLKRSDALHNVHREFGDPMMETLLCRLTPLLETQIGTSLWPTLSFYYTYKKGQQLKPHKDRSSCQIVASVCLGMDEDYQKNQKNWPLHLQWEGQTFHPEANIGDLLVFSGAQTMHWRPPFTGDWFVSAIFAYVEQNSAFAFQKFDQRKALGLPHVGMLKWSLGCLQARLAHLF